MSWWRRSKAVDTASRNSPGADGPVIRLEGVSRVFKGDADEDTWAFRDVTLDIHRGEYRLCFGAIRLRQIDASLNAGAPRYAEFRAYWLNGRAVNRMSPPSGRAPAASTSA